MKLFTKIKYPDIKSKLLLKKKLYENFETEEIIKFQIDNFNKVWSYCYSNIDFYAKLKKNYKLNDKINSLKELDTFPKI